MLLIDLTDAELLKEVNEVRSWSSFAGFVGREEEDRCALYAASLEQEFNRRGYYYPAKREDLQRGSFQRMEAAR